MGEVSSLEESEGLPQQINSIAMLFFLPCIAFGLYKKVVHAYVAKLSVIRTIPARFRITAVIYPFSEPVINAQFILFHIAVHHRPEAIVFAVVVWCKGIRVAKAAAFFNLGICYICSVLAAVLICAYYGVSSWLGYKCIFLPMFILSKHWHPLVQDTAAGIQVYTVGVASFATLVQYGCLRIFIFYLMHCYGIRYTVAHLLAGIPGIIPRIACAIARCLR